LKEIEEYGKDTWIDSIRGAANVNYAYCLGNRMSPEYILNPVNVKWFGKIRNEKDWASSIPDL
jgi:hypothetical protein